MLVPPLKNLAPLALLDPEIPGRTEPQQADGSWGINFAAAKGNFPDQGLKVHIPAWANMNKGDSVMLQLLGGVVAQHTITQDSEIGERVTLWVEPGRLQTGASTLSYEVKRLSQQPEPYTPPVKLDVKLELPGGQDLDPDWGHSGLYMAFEPPQIVQDGVDKDTVEDGVYIIVMAKPGSGSDRPYEHIAVGDVITVSWGGKLVLSDPVTEDQIDNPAAHPIKVHIDKATLLAAGDSGLEGLAVTFMVRDRVLNQSEDWCKETRIVVDTGNSRLQAPILEQANGNVLDLDTLADEPLRLRVWAEPPEFRRGDVIIMYIKGTTLEGETIEVSVRQRIEEDPATVVDVFLPNAAARALAKTQAVFSFDLERGEAIIQRSKGRFINIIGEPKRLAAPIAVDEQQGALDPDLPRTTVRIPFDPLIQAGMAIALDWFGIRANWSTYEPKLDWFFPSEDEANDPAGFTITVEGKHLKTLEGGTLKLSYNLLSDEDGEIVSRGSLPAALLNVGEPKFELDEPVVLGEKDGALEPKDLPNGASKVTCRNPVANPTKAKDKVTWQLRDAQAVLLAEDSKTLNSLNADKDVDFPLNAEFVQQYFEARRGEKLSVSYNILRFETGKTSFSNPLVILIGEADGQLLPPAKVVQAPDGVLDPANAPATVRIEANRPENAGDHFYLRWATTDGTTVHTDDKSITGSMKGKPVEFTVDQETVLACLNKTVTINYRVELLEGGESKGEDYSLRVEQQQFTLPVATFREASGTQKDQINPDDVFPLGATVVIPASAQLKTDDEITVTVEGKTTVTYPHTVLADQADKELAVIKVAHAFILAQLDDSIALSYTVKRKAGGTDGPSAATVYDVHKVISAGTLKVLGARFNRSTYRASSASRVLSAFNATTGQPIQAQWKYPDDTQWTTAPTWRDSHPQEPLQVRSADDQLTLNPANIIGNGADTTVTGQAAFVAHRDVGDVVGWGNAAYGASIPPTIITMDDIVEVSCTRSAYAARRANSAVVVWGTAAEGANMGAIDPMGFVQVVGNATAFAGIKSNGSVVAWGTAADGATVPAPIASLTDIQQVVAAGQAFAALRATGQVVAWGLATNGATVPSDIGGFTDIKTLLGSFGAFAAHRANGRIVGWGHATFGGAVPEAIAALTDITELSCANAQAFTARRATGQVVAWGTAAYGGTIDSLIGGLTDIVEISSTWRAFAARRGNGHVVAWGAAAEGGTVPADIASLDDIVQVCGSSMAFAALRKNGTVVAWGNATVGGNTATVVGQLTNVVAIYDNTHGFCALTSDGRVVTWGQAAGGGDSSAVQDRLNGKVSYRATPASRGLALKVGRGSRISE
ncbi:hypothetical protein [Pseudomonas sp. CLCA07]